MPASGDSGSGAGADDTEMLPPGGVYAVAEGAAEGAAQAATAVATVAAERAQDAVKAELEDRFGAENVAHATEAAGALAAAAPLLAQLENPFKQQDQLRRCQLPYDPPDKVYKNFRTLAVVILIAIPGLGDFPSMGGGGHSQKCATIGTYVVGSDVPPYVIPAYVPPLGGFGPNSTGPVVIPHDTLCCEPDDEECCGRNATTGELYVSIYPNCYYTRYIVGPWYTPFLSFIVFGIVVGFCYHRGRSECSRQHSRIGSYLQIYGYGLRSNHLLLIAFLMNWTTLTSLIIRYYVYTSEYNCVGGGNNTDQYDARTPPGCRDQFLTMQGVGSNFAYGYVLCIIVAFGLTDFGRPAKPPKRAAPTAETIAQLEPKIRAAIKLKQLVLEQVQHRGMNAQMGGVSIRPVDVIKAVWVAAQQFCGSEIEGLLDDVAGEMTDFVDGFGDDLRGVMATASGELANFEEDALVLANQMRDGFDDLMEPAGPTSAISGLVSAVADEAADQVQAFVVEQKDRARMVALERYEEKKRAMQERAAGLSEQWKWHKVHPMVVLAFPLSIWSLGSQMCIQDNGDWRGPPGGRTRESFDDISNKSYDDSIGWWIAILAMRFVWWILWWSLVIVFIRCTVANFGPCVHPLKVLSDILTQWSKEKAQHISLVQLESWWIVRSSILWNTVHNQLDRVENPIGLFVVVFVVGFLIMVLYWLVWSSIYWLINTCLALCAVLAFFGVHAGMDVYQEQQRHINCLSAFRLSVVAQQTAGQASEVVRQKVTLAERFTEQIKKHDYQPRILCLPLRPALLKAMTGYVFTGVASLIVKMTAMSNV